MLITQEPSIEELFDEIVPGGFTFNKDMNHLQGEHVSYLTAQALKMLELHMNTSGSQLDILSSILEINSNPDLKTEVSDKITEVFRKLIENGFTDLALAVSRRVAGLRGEIVQKYPHGISIGENPPYPIDENGNYIIESDYDDVDEETANHLSELLEKIRENPTLVEASGVVEELNKFITEQKASGIPMPGINQPVGFGRLQRTFERFDDMNIDTNNVLKNIFDNIGLLAEMELNSDVLMNHFDIATNNVLNRAYEHTSNNINNLPSFLDILSRFENDDNEYKSDLYKRIKVIMDYVSSYDVNNLGLNVEYTQLRLSQIIPNYFLKKRHFILDASACSSGKTGTILLAPAEINAKATIVLVENNSYTDIKSKFDSWYSTRKDFVILGKDDFWNDEWMKSEKNVIIILDKTFLSLINDREKEDAGQETFSEYIKRSPLDCLIGDEVHNFKGKANGTSTKDFYEDGEEERSHTYCSRNFEVMALKSEYRLFCSATPMMNDFTEPAKLLKMLLPSRTEKAISSRYFNFRRGLSQVTDTSSNLNNIIDNALKVYQAYQIASTSVPRPKVQDNIKTVSNEGLELIGNDVNPSSSDNYQSWTNAFFEYIRDNELKEKMTSDVWKDMAFHPLYLILLKKYVIRELKSGNQICFYTNSSCQSHRFIKNWVLTTAKEAGIQLNKNEVVIANGSTSDELRREVQIKLDNGSVVSRTKLVQSVWNQKCKVLIANNVISVGLDGLQGIDKIDGCGRISAVFRLANSYTEAMENQNKCRFVRTQGSDSSQFPDVQFYEPDLFVYCSEDEDEDGVYCRNQQTKARVSLKAVKANLMMNGEFPQQMNMVEFQSHVIDLYDYQLNNGLFFTDEADEERQELTEEYLSLL